jgi:SAM-dependent methyltransferase
MPTAPEGWFDRLADFLGPAYLRNAFTKGTEQEVSFLVEALELRPGMRVLDIGCGPGRHSLALARRGIDCTGVDRAESFIALARASAAAESLAATFEVADVRDLAYDGEFDAAICLCQGGFGLLAGAESSDLLARFGRALRPGGRLALSAFHAYFALRFLEEGDTFDAATGVNHEVARLRDAQGSEESFDLWTTCFTARELRLLATSGSLAVTDVHGVTPGDYGARPPSLDRPELLVLARRPV